MRTPLYDRHKTLNGKMVDFAGWELPVQYNSAIDEHMAVRTKAGLFDVSHMGEIEVEGKGSRAFLSSLIPTSLSKLSEHAGMYSCLCKEKGGVIDDLFIFMISPEKYYLVVNAGTKDKDLDWLLKHRNGDTVIRDVSDNTAKIDIQGPLAAEILKKVFPQDAAGKIEGLERFHFMYHEFSGTRVMISFTGYTGEPGYELFIKPESAGQLWDALIDKGAAAGLIPCGLASRDSLRLEACYSLYGHEINENINPVEAGLSWIINSDEKYIGSEFLKNAKASGAARKIYCLEIADRGIPREGYRVELEGKEIGYVTSGGYSPVKKKGIALALLNTGSVKTGDYADIIIRDKPVKAQVVKKPFYSFNSSNNK